MSHVFSELQNIKILPSRCFSGSPEIPGDKSISHRALILGALAQGETKIENLLRSGDINSTEQCLRGLGVNIQSTSSVTKVLGVGLYGFKAPNGPLNCGNSGTTMRTLMGILAAQSFNSILIGDASLSKRPMKRIAEPLGRMGADISLVENEFAPIEIRGKSLTGIQYDLPIASAQLKTALLLAGLHANGITLLRGKMNSRDHTERLLPHFGVSLEHFNSESLSIEGGKELVAADVVVPGDPSTAAFWAAAACIIPSGSVKIEKVSLNPTRNGFLNVLERMGARIKTTVETTHPEPMGTISVSYSDLKAVTIEPNEVPFLIDELPLIAILGTHAEGVTEIRGAEELRFKETDRIRAIVKNLEAMNARVTETPDGFRIEGKQKLRGARIQSYDDHRIAMAFSIAGLAAEKGETEIIGAKCVAISYPHFFEHLKMLTPES